MLLTLSYHTNKQTRCNTVHEISNLVEDLKIYKFYYYFVFNFVIANDVLLNLILLGIEKTSL